MHQLTTPRQVPLAAPLGYVSRKPSMEYERSVPQSFRRSLTNSPMLSGARWAAGNGTEVGVLAALVAFSWYGCEWGQRR